MNLNSQTIDSETAGTLAERIVYARENQGLTTAQLARRLGVESATLQGWESGRQEPRSSRVSMLAGMLNVSLVWLLTGRGDRPDDTLNPTEMMKIRESIERMREQAISLTNELEHLEERLGSYESFHE
jgi:transcriptional regulator with XRE-family HTH domain